MPNAKRKDESEETAKIPTEKELKGLFSELDLVEEKKGVVGAEQKAMIDAFVKKGLDKKGHSILRTLWKLDPYKLSVTLPYLLYGIEALGLDKRADQYRGLEINGENEGPVPSIDEDDEVRIHGEQIDLEDAIAKDARDAAAMEHGVRIQAEMKDNPALAGVTLETIETDSAVISFAGAKPKKTKKPKKADLKVVPTDEPA